MSVLNTWRRHRLRKAPLPQAWVEILGRRAPFVDRLNPDERRRFDGDLQLFLEDKIWSGAEGFEMTDEVLVTIAAHAVRLSVHRSLRLWARLIEVVVHPSSFTLFGAEDELLLGACVTAKRTDTVRLAWDAVLAGLADPIGRTEAGIEALAGVLDTGPDAPLPPPARTHVRAWADTLGRQYVAMNSETPPAVRAVIGQPDRFAVATEGFFERPARLRTAAARIYAELARFYRCDPAARA